jgi:hypothetical protein
VGGPPEPFVEELIGPDFSLIRPELAERFLEAIPSVDLEIDLFKRAQPDRLVICQVPWILEPDVPGVLEQLLVLLAFLPNLVPTDLVDSLI